MKRRRLVVIIVISCLLLAIVAPYFLLESETTLLDDKTRASLPGSFLRLPDGVVHYQMNNIPSARTVVLVHGFSVPYYVWDPTYGALTAAGFRVLRFDLYGRGYSDRPNREYNVELFVSQLRDLLDTLGIHQPVDLVGLSLGAAVIADFCSQYTKRVHSLVFIAPAVSGTTQLGTFPLGVPGVGEYLMATVFAPFYLPRIQKSDFFRPNLFPDWESRYRDQTKYRGFKRALLSTIRSLPKMNALPWYKEVGEAQLPVLLLWGQGDKTIPSTDIGLLQELVPRIESHSVKEAGHLPQYEQPAAVSSVLIRFLRNLVQ